MRTGQVQSAWPPPADLDPFRFRFSAAVEARGKVFDYDPCESWAIVAQDKHTGSDDPIEFPYGVLFRAAAIELFLVESDTKSFPRRLENRPHVRKWPRAQSLTGSVHLPRFGAGLEPDEQTTLTLIDLQCQMPWQRYSYIPEQVEIEGEVVTARDPIDLAIIPLSSASRPGL